MRVYISGLFSGPNPSPGLGIARSLRMAYPGSSLVGVDYSNRSSGLHWPDFDEIWLQRPWDELDLAEYGRQIQRILDSGGLWISGLDLETLWLASVIPDHPNLVIPPIEALRKVAKPTISAHEGLPVRIPPFISTSRSDWELHAFCRKHSWRVWLKGPFYEARRVRTWNELNLARAELAGMWSTDGLFLQAHITGYEESIVLAAYQGTVLDCVYMSKRDITPEGKTWAGQITELSEDIKVHLERIISDIKWTGGAELEMIRDVQGNLWLMEWNPRFPAWIYGSTIAGHNLPGLLVEKAANVPAKETTFTCQGFVRIVLEIPLRSQFPLPPLPEPAAGSFGLSLKHPSGMPTLAQRMRRSQAHDNSTQSASCNDTSAPAVPSSILNDIASYDLTQLQTPCWLLLRSTTQTMFQHVADMASRLTTSRIQTAIAYSIKTNPDDQLLELARKSGFLVEAISQLEVEKATFLGFTPHQIVLNGPGKWWPSNKALSSPFRAVFCDSLEELMQVVNRITRGEDLARVIGIRLRPPQVYSRFGIPVGSYETFKQLLPLVRSIPTEYSFGIHFHIASSAIGIQQWWHLYEAMLRWSTTIETASGRKVECLDIGGGWFPDDFAPEFEPRLENTMSHTLDMLREIGLLIMEPGKALVQPSMALAVRVMEVRRSQGQSKEVVVDGSIAEVPGVFLYPHRILWLDTNGKELKALGRGDARIVGRLCMEDDILAWNIAIPEDLQSGDTIIICDVGAYDRSTSYVFGQG